MQLIMSKININHIDVANRLFIISLRTIGHNPRSRRILKSFTYSTRSKALDASSNNK